MEVLELTNADLQVLKPLSNSCHICHTESDLYYDPHNKNRVLKIYKLRDDKVWMRGKFKSIQNLIKFTSIHNIPELIRPDRLVIKNDEFIGIRLPLIEGVNASYYLNSRYVPIEIRIAILKQIGAILKKIYMADNTTAFGDVHGHNFMVENPNDYGYDVSKIHTTAIDTDSMKLYDSPGVINFYLYDNKNLYNMDKYEENAAGIVKPSYNTDLFCFIMMIFEVISDDKYFFSIPLIKYRRYIDYLDKLGFDSNLLNALISVYEDDKDNIDPTPYLDSLIKVSDESSFRSHIIRGAHGNH